MSEVSVSEVDKLEQLLAEKKVLIDRRQMALRLYNNPDFRKLILDGFCLVEAARYVHTSGDPAIGVQERQDALNLAQASGHLKRFLSVCVQAGAYAERTLTDVENELDEARAEEGAV